MLKCTKVMHHVCSLRGYRKPCIMYSRMQNLLFASAGKCVHATVAVLDQN